MGSMYSSPERRLGRLPGDSPGRHLTRSIPQMLVLDPRGRIRFHLVDLLPDRYFQRSVDWMIEAALK